MVKHQQWLLTQVRFSIKSCAPFSKLVLSFIGFCLTKIYILAFTSGLNHAGTDSGHNVEVNVRGAARHRPLYDRPGDDAMKHKGDLWVYNFSQFGFPYSCIKIGDIRTVSITEGSNDGWNIESIVVLVVDAHGGAEAITADFGVNQWVDGDGSQSHRRFTLRNI